MSEAYNSMITGYIIGAIIGLVINGFLARIPAKMAEEKGYSYGGYWCLSFFFTFIAGMLVAACIPDRNTSKKNNESYSNYHNNASASVQYNYKQSCNQNTINNMVIPSKKHIKSLDLGYSLDVSVQITKAELLFDEAQDSLYLDLEIYNVSDKVITFLDMSVECYDTVGDKLSDDYIVEHSLIDISTKPREVFEDILIKINDKRIRNIKVNIKKLMFEDGKVVRYTGDETLVQNVLGKKVDDIDANLLNYLKKYIASELGESVLPIKYFPNVNSDFIWTCCCGRKNTLEKDKCCLCGRNKEEQMKLINEECIERAYVEHQELEKKQEEERKKQHELDIKAIKEAERLAEKKRQEVIRLEKEKRAKRKKIVAIEVGGILIVTCLMIYLSSSYIPSQKYNEALKLKDNKEYDEAIKILDEIAFYKDAPTIVMQIRQELKYIDACDLEDKKNYDGAVKLFYQLDDYKDADERLKNITYTRKLDVAGIFIDEENYKMALEVYKNVEDEEISNTLNNHIKQMVYEKAISFSEGKQYIKSNKVLYILEDYRDSPQRIIDNKYNHAMALMSNGEGISSCLFRELDNYKDFIEQAYKKAKDYVDEKEYSKAINLFNGLGKYKDTPELKKQCKLDYEALLNEVFGPDSKYKNKSKKRELFINLINKSKHVISASDNHVVALKRNGTVVAKASSYYGQCNVGDWQDIVAVSAGQEHTVGLKSDGTVVAVGANDWGQCDVETWSDIVMISAGDDSTIGIKSDGTIILAGHDRWGDDDFTTWNDIVSISGKDDKTVGMTSDGIVLVTGIGIEKFKQEDWVDIVEVSAGNYHILGLKADGTVISTRDEELYGLDEWEDIVAIASGDSHGVGLKKDGTVIVTHSSIHYCPEDEWSDVVAISVGDDFTVGVRADGTVVATGIFSFGKWDVSEWTDIGILE